MTYPIPEILHLMHALDPARPGEPYIRFPNDIHVSFRTLGTVIANRRPDLVGKHIGEQLTALGLSTAFMAAATPFTLPFSFSEYA